MEYDTAFDVSALEFTLWPLVVVGVLASFGMIGYLLALKRRAGRHSSPAVLRIFPKVIATVCVFTWVLPLAFVYLPRVCAVRVLESGAVDFVEGRIESFKPMPPAQHTTEDFTVGGVTFSYSRGRQSTASIRRA
jgi:hypothetical protein